MLCVGARSGCFQCFLLGVLGQETQIILPKKESVTRVLESHPDPGSENGVPSLTHSSPQSGFARSFMN